MSAEYGIHAFPLGREAGSLVMTATLFGPHLDRDDILGWAFLIALALQTTCVLFLDLVDS